MKYLKKACLIFSLLVFAPALAIASQATYPLCIVGVVTTSLRIGNPYFFIVPVSAKTNDIIGLIVPHLRPYVGVNYLCYRRFDNMDYDKTKNFQIKYDHEHPKSLEMSIKDKD